MPKNFVYVYDMPSKFNSEILDLPTIWHPEQYDIDQVSPLLSVILDAGLSEASPSRDAQAANRPI